MSHGAAPALDSLQQEKLKKLMAQKFETLVEEAEDSSFQVIIPQLSIFSRGDTLQQAYEAIEQKKKELFTQAVGSGLDQKFESMQADKAKDQALFDLKVHFIKYFLSFGIVVVSLGLALSFFSFFAGSIGHRLGEQVRNVEERVFNTSEEIKKKRLERFDRLLDEVRPYVVKVKALWVEPNQTPRSE